MHRRGHCASILCSCTLHSTATRWNMSSVNVQRNAETFRRAAPHGAAVVVASGAAERIWVDKIGGLLECGWLLFLSNGSCYATYFAV